MRENIQKTIERERTKAAQEEREKNIKEFEKMYQLEDKLRLAEVTKIQAFLNCFSKMPDETCGCRGHGRVPKSQNLRA